MIDDLNSLPDDELLAADVCVIGAGAAGITLALSLADSHLRVLIVESGGLAEESRTQSLYEGEVVDSALHSPPDTYRQRRFGGTTTIWGGRCMPFDDIDFEKRDFLPNSGWPISAAELAPFYPLANQLCEAGEFEYTAERAFSKTTRPMLDGFVSQNFSTNTLERFSCPTDFGARYGHRLRAAKNVRVLLHANVTGILRSPAGSTVSELVLKSLQGRSAKVKARVVVVAAGGLESARLLLTNQLGTEHGIVGRYYMCHLAGTIGTLRFKRPQSVWHGYDLSESGVYCRRRFALRAETQRRLGIGNFIARLHHPRITLPEHGSGVLSLLYLAKPFIPYEYAKRLHGEEKFELSQWLAHLKNVALHPHDAVGFAWHMLRDRKLAERKFPSIIVVPRKPVYSLDIHAEQEPNPASRVLLSDEKDALGVPKIKVDWRYTSGDVATVSRSLDLLSQDLEQSGVGSMEYDPASVEFEMIRYGAYGGHHIGTARMGTTPENSVVNADCRIHGLENVYVASAAVFPTSSQANPTLTVVAMALRLASHLKQELHS